jgi:hypothetical protein
MSRASLTAEGVHERPARLQMIVALALGLLLVALPLYLWRRPRAESINVTTSATPGDGAAAFGVRPAPEPEPPIVLAPPKVLACQDPGPKKTPPEQCDHLESIEQALAKAIEDSVDCAAKEPTGGTIVYVADVSFKRRTVGLLVPREGRTIKTTRTIQACQAAVKSKLHGVRLDGIAHQHARYKIAIAATYVPQTPN